MKVKKHSRICYIVFHFVILLMLGFSSEHSYRVKQSTNRIDKIPLVKGDRENLTFLLNVCFKNMVLLFIDQSKENQKPIEQVRIMNTKKLFLLQRKFNGKGF